MGDGRSWRGGERGAVKSEKLPCRPAGREAGRGEEGKVDFMPSAALKAVSFGNGGGGGEGGSKGGKGLLTGGDAGDEEKAPVSDETERDLQAAVFELAQADEEVVVNEEGSHGDWFTTKGVRGIKEGGRLAKFEEVECETVQVLLLEGCFEYDVELVAVAHVFGGVGEQLLRERPLVEHAFNEVEDNLELAGLVERYVKEHAVGGSGVEDSTEVDDELHALLAFGREIHAELEEGNVRSRTSKACLEIDGQREARLPTKPFGHSGDCLLAVGEGIAEGRSAGEVKDGGELVRRGGNDGGESCHSGSPFQELASG
ncbi:MAG: hypothetical protein SGPRY_008943 [Prymnesium sp.]